MKKHFLIFSLLFLTFNLFAQKINSLNGLHEATATEKKKYNTKHLRDTIYVFEINLDSISSFDNNEQLIIADKNKIVEMNADFISFDKKYYADEKGKIKAIKFVEKSESEKLKYTKKLCKIYGIDTNDIKTFFSEELHLNFYNENNNINRAAPKFDVVDLHNNHYILKKLKGNVIVLNFWSPKYGNCIKEIPDLNILKKKYEGENVKFIAITFGSEEAFLYFNKTFDFIMVIDREDVCKSYKVSSYPTSFIIDKNGNIRYYRSGTFPNITKSFSEKIDELLK